MRSHTCAVAVDPDLAREFPWLKVDPAPILGDSRPRSLTELWEKSQLWQNLYRDWLGAHNPSFLEGLNSIANIEVRLGEYTEKFEQAYPAFYKAAGELKDAVRKNEAAARQRFPWAPADVKSLLGDARPKKFDALISDGHDGAWVPAFQGWLRARPPFQDADAWLDWVLMRGGGEAWERELAPTFEEFAKDVGTLKDKLRAKHGNTFERGVRQVGEAVGEAKARLDEQTEKLANAKIGVDAAGQFRAGMQQGERKAQTQTQAQQKPEQQGSGAQKPGTQGAQKPGAQQQQQPAKKTPPPVPSRVPRYVSQQVRLAYPLLTLTPHYTGYVDYIAQRFAAFGGPIGEVANSIYGYKGLVEGDAAYVAQQAQVVSERLAGSDDASLYALLSTLRAAVYRLAWNIDLGFQTYYNGWPHEHLPHIVETIRQSESPQLRFAGGRALHALTNDLQNLYDTAAGVLDAAKEMLDEQVPSYTIEDGVVPWGTHEVVGAKNALGGIASVTSSWAGEQPAEEADASTADEAAMSAFGMGYHDLLQVG